MLIRLAADALMLLHFGFIAFVVIGGWLVLRWPRLAWFHLPCAVWGALIELAGWICPLTPLERRLRLAGGEEGFAGGFIDHYLMPLVYPPGLTRTMQIVLGVAVLAINAVAYALVLRRRRQRRQPAAGEDPVA